MYVKMNYRYFYRFIYYVIRYCISIDTKIRSVFLYCKPNKSIQFGTKEIIIKIKCIFVFVYAKKKLVSQFLKIMRWPNPIRNKYFLYLFQINKFYFLVTQCLPNDSHLYALVLYCIISFLKESNVKKSINFCCHEFASVW